MNKSWWWLAGFIIVGVVLVTGVLNLVTRPPRGKPITLLPPPTPAPVKVYVSGGVHKPGFYSLPRGSRVNDAIQAAGGFTDEADASRLNLAKPLVDGEQIHIPSLQVDPIGGGNTKSTDPFTALVDINTATLEQLETLPGIGEKMAQAIIDFRNSNGPFTRIEDILEVPRIGEVIFDQIKDLITVGVASP